MENIGTKLVGKWKHSVYTPPWAGASSTHDMKEQKAKKSVTFVSLLPKVGCYDFWISRNSNVRKDNGVAVTIRHADCKTVMQVNEAKEAPVRRFFRSLDSFHLEKGKSGSVTVSTTSTDGQYVAVDTV